MKKLLKITAVLLVAAVLAGGFMLPDFIFRFLDQKSSAVKSEELSAVTLDLTKELTLCQKAGIAATEQAYINVPIDQATRTPDEVMLKANNFFSDICIKMNGPHDVSLNFEFVGTMLFVSQEPNRTAIFWEVHAYYNDVYLHFLIDDSTLSIIRFTWIDTSGKSENELISEEMRQLAECVREIIGIQFGNAVWRPIKDEFVYADIHVQEEQEIDYIENPYITLKETYMMTVVEEGITYNYNMQYNSHEIAFNIRYEL